MTADCLGIDSDTAEQFDESEIVFTAGVSSGVTDAEGERQHVLLLDCDSTDLITIYNAAAAMQGVTAVFESSQGSYHIWNLTVRPFEQAILSALSWQIADAEHVKQSYRRGYFVLRLVGKVHGDGEQYKQAPKLLDVFTDFDGFEGAVSMPHLRWLLTAADEQGVRVDLPDPADVRTVGKDNGLAVDRYMTLTDAAKASLRGEQ